MVELQADLQYILSDRLKVSIDASAQFCQRWNIVEFALFGSVLREDFRPDIAILAGVVKFLPHPNPPLTEGRE